MPRTLLDGQRSRILLVDVVTGTSEVVFDSAEILVEAPNWSPDGASLVVNADGLLWRLPVGAAGESVAAAATALEPIEMVGVPEINNDHVIAPDGASVFVSAQDGHLYEIPWSGGTGRRVTRDHPQGLGYKNYLHGISPDGSTLAVVVGARPDESSGPESWRTNVALVSVADGETTFLTDDEHPDDGAEFSPDGEWVWFNSERYGSEPGHAQLARVRKDGTSLEQVLESGTVDWFPHPAPDASRLLFLAYPAGTLGHPADREVVLRVLDLDAGAAVAGSDRNLLALSGGQGTINVPGWAPDSTRFACADYPRAGHVSSRG
jgi:TolB protein